MLQAACLPVLRQVLPFGTGPLPSSQSRGYAAAPYSYSPPGRNHLAVPGKSHIPTVNPAIYSLQL